MSKKTIIMSGCDAKFYPFLEEAMTSLFDLNLRDHADFGILDLGLAPEQIAALKSWGCIIVQPTWTIDVPQELRVNHQIGLVARTALREYFPGYQVYIWFDADAWAQTPEFFHSMVEGVQSQGAAIIRENGAGMHRNALYNKWWYGHMMASFGIINGLKVAYPPAINIGLVALSDTAPHWDAWIRYYKIMIDKRHKTNLDQHAFAAAIELDHLPAALLPARTNWITTLSAPYWDAKNKMLCEPKASNTKPLSVIHMAGPDKRRDYELRTLDGSILRTPVTAPAIKALQK